MTISLKRDQLLSVIVYLSLILGIANFLPFNKIFSSLITFLIIIMGWKRLCFVARIIALVIMATGIITIFFEPASFVKASRSMAEVSTLVLSVMMLSAVLSTSTDVGKVSGSLFKGASTPRYLGLSFGTALLSVPLNIGAVGLISTMIGKQIQEGGDNAATRNGARAVIRGFGASPMFSPLSVAIIITVTLLPGVSSWKLIAWSLPFAFIYILLGLLFREQEKSPPILLEDDFDENSSVYWSWVRLALLILFIASAAFIFNNFFDLRYSQSVTLSCIIVVLFNLCIQRIFLGTASFPSLANVSNELAIMGGSTFIGSIISIVILGFVGVDLSSKKEFFLIITFFTPWIFYIAGLGGINPIITATILGGILAPVWPESALMGFGIAMITGWGATVSGTPYSANALLLQRFTGYKVEMAYRQWNLSYSFVFLGISGTLCTILVFVSF